MGVKVTLIQLEQLLRRTHAYGWANKLERCIANFDEEFAQTCDYLASAAVWGSSGSLLDLRLDPANGHASDDFHRDNQTLVTLLIELIDELREHGCDTEPMRSSRVFLQGALKRYQHR